MSEVRRYRGRTPAEAMRRAREAEGDDARLVSARRVSPPDLPPVYEVRVIHGPGPADVVGGGLDALRVEIESLRRTISELKASPATAAAPTATAAEEEEEGEGEGEGEGEEPKTDEAYERWLDVLRRRGVGLAHARRLVKSALRRAEGTGSREAFDALSAVLAEEFQRVADDQAVGERSTVFVGLTGAGKTTVLSKVATDLVRRGVRPVLVTTDGESLAGEESLQSVAEALDLRFETAFLAGQLEALVEQESGAETFLVDTPGRSPFTPDGVESLRSVVRALPDAEVLLVIPATTDGEEARAVIEGFASLRVSRVVLTKLDELCRPGRIVDLAKAVTRPIARITYGREVCGSSASPGDPRVVTRVLGTSRSLEASG